MISFFKFVCRLAYRTLLHSVNALYDFFRYVRYSNFLCHSTRDRRKLESLLFFYYHKIEKALALPDVKPVFGLGYIETLLDLVDEWVHLTGDLEAVVFRSTYASLLHYREHVGETLAQQRPDIVRRIDQLLSKYEEISEHADLGGTVTLTSEELHEAIQSIDFDLFIQCRRSVRNFNSRNIADSAIEEAVRLAQRSPSVCNRQCWRVHVFTSQADKAKVLACQRGNAGFGHLADRVLLITADLRAFLFSGERNQAYADAGMFAMTLLYALQARGIASCCLNLCTSFFQDVALRQVCRIAEYETPVMMILIGYPPKNLEVAKSARMPTDSMLFFRNLEETIDARSHSEFEGPKHGAE